MPAQTSSLPGTVLPPCTGHARPGGTALARPAHPITQLRRAVRSRPPGRGRPAANGAWQEGPWPC
jgi:hypothetical protein